MVDSPHPKCRGSVERNIPSDMELSKQTYVHWIEDALIHQLHLDG